jgi:hypothetical protein
MVQVINERKVLVSKQEVKIFNASWPCSNLNHNRHYWFEFDVNGDLIDTDVPEHSDGQEAAAMAEDCKAYLFRCVESEWMIS